MAASAADDLLEALSRLPTMAHPVIDSSGEQIALYYDITGRNEIHVYDVAANELEQWSAGEVPRDARWFLQWGPQDDRVFFHKDRDGNEQNDIYAIDREGSVETIVQLDGQAVIFDIGEAELLFGSDRDGQMNLYRHRFETGGVEKLTDYDRAVRDARLAPDGTQVAYATNETDDFDNVDVYIANVDGSDPRNLNLGEVGAEASPVDWSPAGDRLLVADNTTDVGRSGVYHCDTKTVDWYGDMTTEEDPISFLPAGDRFAVARDREAVTMPVICDCETGEQRELDVPEGVASMSPLSRRLTLKDGRLVFQHTTPVRRPELQAYDLAADGSTTLLEAEYGPFEPADFVDAEYLTVKSNGVPGTPANAVEHRPAEEFEIGALLYDSGTSPSPLVVNPHGGPRVRDDKSFDLYTQVLAARGYAVLQVNYRGSAGRGREFAEQLIDDWGGAEQGDIATATEHVVSDYDRIDGNRVAIFGRSFGGYSTYWQMVQYPELYDAAVAWVGVTDLEDMYEHTMPHFRTELMEKYLGTPEEHPTRYEERSPITHVENIESPILIVHGVNDRRVPVSQARRFRDALESAGFEAGKEADFEYHELGAEGHGSTDQDQKLRMFQLLDDFLARRLRAS